MTDPFDVADQEKPGRDDGQAGGKPPVKKTTTRKPAKPKTENVEAEPKAKESLVQEIEADVEKVAEEAKQAVESEVTKAKEVVDEEITALKKLTVPELRQMYQDALHLESEAKRELYVLRLRFANFATDVGEEAERDLAVARIRVEEAAAWLKKIEKALEGEFKDIVGVAKF